MVWDWFGFGLNRLNGWTRWVVGGPGSTITACVGAAYGWQIIASI